MFFYLLSNVVVPENMLAVDIGTPPIIISVELFIGIVLRLPAGKILSKSMDYEKTMRRVHG